MKALLLYALLIAILFVASSQARTEEERVREYHTRNYTWPVPKFQPDTPGWDKLMRHRLRQIEEIEEDVDRFEAYAQTLSAGLVQPNYTEHGFGLARAPEELMEALREGIRDGLEKGPREEYYIPVITGLRPWFIDRPDLTKRVLNELQQYPEAWTGMELTPVVAYGFRLYRNQSSLNVHVDKSETHVISFILHIDSSEDAEPWPIFIEDFQGNTHEVILTSGDILFYESSKCFHGRPTKLNGSWYSSIFVHYYPTIGYQDKYAREDKVFAIPPHWNEKPGTHLEERLQMLGTSFEEPDCPHGWCATQYSNKWSGPGEEGYYITPTGEKRTLNIQPSPCEDKNDRCSAWASSESNECDRNAAYMHKNCRKSCQLCSPLSHDEL